MAGPGLGADSRAARSGSTAHAKRGSDRNGGAACCPNEHLDQLADELSGVVAVLHGGVKPTAGRSSLAQHAEHADNEPTLVVATRSYIGAGFDDPRPNTVLLTMPICLDGTVIQYAGRLHRAHPPKREIQIYDYIHSEIPVLRRRYAKRVRTYTDMGYTTNDQLAVPVDTAFG